MKNPDHFAEEEEEETASDIDIEWAPLVPGIPQGTVLGPLLFSLYISDISTDIESEIRLFVDDSV